MSSASTLVTDIVLVDDHEIVRRGMRQLFEREEDFRVCGEAATEVEAFDMVEALEPDLLITDLTLEGRSGLDLIKRVRAYHPELPILVVSMHDERIYARRVLAAGAQGYVMKRHADSEVLEAARRVRDGSVYVGRAARLPLEPAADAIGENGSLDILTDREFEIFLLIGQGFMPRHVAERLSLSVSTVEVYRQRIKEKLEIDSSTMLLRYAVRWCKDHGET